MICPTTKVEYFCAKGWTDLWVICPSGPLAFPELLCAGALRSEAPRKSQLDARQEPALTSRADIGGSACQFRKVPNGLMHSSKQPCYSASSSARFPRIAAQAAMPSSAKCAGNALINWARWRISRSHVRCCINWPCCAELQAARVFVLSGTRRSLASAACAPDAPAS
jgi:hypothetical protein